MQYSYYCILICYFSWVLYHYYYYYYWCCHCHYHYHYHYGYHYHYHNHYHYHYISIIYFLEESQQTERNLPRVFSKSRGKLGLSELVQSIINNDPPPAHNILDEFISEKMHIVNIASPICQWGMVTVHGMLTSMTNATAECRKKITYWSFCGQNVFSGVI